MITLFDLEGCEVRIAGTVESPEWVAADVCGILGIDLPANVLRGFDDDEKGMCSIHTLGGTQELLTVTRESIKTQFPAMYAGQLGLGGGK